MVKVKIHKKDGSIVDDWIPVELALILICNG